jgi:hypothetical protein
MKKIEVRDKEVPKKSQKEKEVEKKTPVITIREKSTLKKN